MRYLCFMKKSIFIVLCAMMLGVLSAEACTSMIVSSKASASGRPLMWKHRDTGADNNFIARVDAANESEIGYVGLFNAGDSLFREAWMGMNDNGFAIMNTASYNLAPDTAKFKDQEGVVMAMALKHCTTADDFEALLGALPKPLGVQANFGVIDANGGAAYFETDDYSWQRFDVADSDSGVLIRTNYSVSGEDGNGAGYIRYNTAKTLSEAAIANHDVTPELLTEQLSRSFYHSLIGEDLYERDIVVNQDFIPRDISTSSIVIEGVNAGDNVSGIRMWAALGYPPCSAVNLVTLRLIPVNFMPSGTGWRSTACDKSMELRRSTIPYFGGSGPKYIDLRKLRPINERMRAEALRNYRDGRRANESVLK